MKRKYVTEYALHYMNSNVLVITADHLMSDNTPSIEMSNALDNCHIYFITTRPRPYFKPDKFKYQNNFLSGSLFYKISGVEYEISFKDYPWKKEKETVNTICPYPHREIHNIDTNSEIVTYFPASLLALSKHISDDLKDLKNYEVLYIGQALGNQGNRSAYQRLKSHSTFQKILARTQYDFPDKEIMIFMYEFDHEQYLTSIDGAAKNADTSEKNEARLFNAIRKPPHKKQKIGLIEAALIRYFQPQYNNEYKLKFPSPKHKVLKSCQDLDITGLMVEICSDLNDNRLDYVLYSNTQKPNYYHFANIELVSEKNRMSFFNSTNFPNTGSHIIK